MLSLANGGFSKLSWMMETITSTDMVENEFQSLGAATATAISPMTFRTFSRQEDFCCWNVSQSEMHCKNL